MDIDDMIRQLQRRRGLVNDAIRIFEAMEADEKGLPKRRGRPSMTQEQKDSAAHRRLQNKQQLKPT